MTSHQVENSQAKDFRIRKYAHEDLKAVRAIACQTADIGAPLLLTNPEDDIVADILTRYYTDFEPESAWVIEKNNTVLGYLLGSLYPVRHSLINNFIIIPRIILKALCKGVLFSRKFWQIIWGGMFGILSAAFLLRKYIRDFPAHFHIDLLPDARRQNLGEELTIAFEEKAKALGIKGVHVRVRNDNIVARNFFEKLGYRILFESLLVNFIFKNNMGATFRFLTYGKKIPSQ